MMIKEKFFYEGDWNYYHISQKPMCSCVNLQATRTPTRSGVAMTTTTTPVTTMVMRIIMVTELTIILVMGLGSMELLRVQHQARRGTAAVTVVTRVTGGRRRMGWSMVQWEVVDITRRRKEINRATSRTTMAISKETTRGTDRTRMSSMVPVSRQPGQDNNRLGRHNSSPWQASNNPGQDNNSP